MTSKEDEFDMPEVSEHLDWAEEANSGVLFDQRTKAVMAPHHSTGDNFKAKIAKVRECVPNNIKKDDIIIILEHFDYDATKAISAFTDGDADSILQTWTISGKKGKGAPSGRNKRKRNRQGNQTVNSVDNDASKTENIQNPPTKQMSGAPPISKSSNETTTSAKSDTAQLPQPSNNNVQNEPNLNYTTDKGRGPRGIRQEPAPKQNAQSSRQGGRRNDYRGQRSNQQRSQPQPKGPSAQSNSRRRDPVTESDGAIGEQRTGKGAAAKSQVITKETTSTDSNVQTKKKQGANLERLEKDLHRTTVSLTRCKNLLTNELEESEKRMKKAFQEVKRHLQEREIAVLNDFNDVRIQAESLIDNRQKTAAELKKKIDKCNYNSLPEEEFLELKASLKHFVSNRKTDEEIAQTMRFTYNPDQLITEIKSFGDVNMEVSQYSSRRPSLSSLSTISRTTSVCEDTPQPLSRGVSLSESLKSPDSPGPKSPDMDISAEADNFATKIQQKFHARRGGGPARRGPRNPSGGRGRQDGGRRRQASGGQQRNNDGQSNTQDSSKENQGPRRKPEGGRGDQKGHQQKDKPAATKSVNSNAQRGSDTTSKSVSDGSPDAQLQKESPRKQRNFIRRQQHRKRQGNEGRQNSENHPDTSPKKDEGKETKATKPTENGPKILDNEPNNTASEPKPADIAPKVVENGQKEQLNGVDPKLTAPQIEIDTSNDTESGASVGSTPVSSPGTSSNKQSDAANHDDKEVISNGPLVNGNSKDEDRSNGDEGYHEDISTTAEKKIKEREKLEKETTSSSPPVMNGGMDEKSEEDISGEN